MYLTDSFWSVSCTDVPNIGGQHATTLHNNGIPTQGYLRQSLFAPYVGPLVRCARDAHLQPLPMQQTLVHYLAHVPEGVFADRGWGCAWERETVRERVGERVFAFVCVASCCLSHSCATPAPSHATDACPLPYPRTRGCLCWPWVGVSACVRGRVRESVCERECVWESEWVCERVNVYCMCVCVCVCVCVREGERECVCVCVWVC